MRFHLTLAGGTGPGEDVVVDADPDTPMAQVLAALAQVRDGPFWLDGAPLSDRGRLGDSGIRDGVVLRNGSAPMPTASRAGGLEVAVVSGPHAGRFARCAWSS